LWETTFACLILVFFRVNGAALTIALSLAATFGTEGDVPVAVATW
jgi:hypothetical protein